jgi:4-hydroxythreonine-4-phosphate dehydrogenase
MIQPPRLALTLGDPAGIGAEIILKSLAHPQVLNLPVKLTVVGDRRQVQTTFSLLKNSTNVPLADPDSIDILDTSTDLAIALGQGDARSGEASFTYLDTAISHTLAGDFDAIVTAPIAKSTWKQAGHIYPGQTELLAERSNISQFGMLFVGDSPYTGWQLRTLLATVHVPLAQVTEVLTPQLVEAKLELLWRSLQHDFGLKTARIAIAGINPHSGEQGQLGTEEQAWLAPLIQSWQAKYPNLQLDGPIPPDTMWVRPGQAWRDRTQVHLGHDAYLAMYHDQGLIPVKLLAFEQAVNTTIGLPFIRTSPDHGTAFDIAGKGIAKPASLIAAIALAAKLAQKKCGFLQIPA